MQESSLIIENEVFVLEICIVYMDIFFLTYQCIQDQIIPTFNQRRQNRSHIVAQVG